MLVLSFPMMCIKISSYLKLIIEIFQKKWFKWSTIVVQFLGGLYKKIGAMKLYKKNADKKMT